MPHSDHFVHLKTQAIRPNKKTMFDRLVTVVSVLYPLSAAPQAYQVLTGHVDGVSVLSWLGFLVCAVLFLIYGLKHKVSPMIISNSLWIFVDAVVVGGILQHTLA